jgi:serine/threonine protein phosphatase PrpC
VAETPEGNIVFGLVCDGVGGLAQGELASAHVVTAFSDWFGSELPSMAGPDNADRVAARWEALLSECNDRIMAHGAKCGAKMGTTASAILIQTNGDYLIAHVGDSRIYEIGDSIRALTKDHTVVAAAVEAGRLTPQQAREDARRHVLTQCVGASPALKPDIFSGKAPKDSLILLCSDGLYNKVSDQEFHMILSPFRSASAAPMDRVLEDMVTTCKARGETDNITALLIRLS